MTNKKAAEVISNLRKESGPIFTKQVDDALNRAVIALKFNLKRSPRAPHNNVCPTCGISCESLLKSINDYEKHRIVYCWNCGQAIKVTNWRTEETNV